MSRGENQSNAQGGCEEKSGGVRFFLLPRRRGFSGGNTIQTIIFFAPKAQVVPSTKNVVVVKN